MERTGRSGPGKMDAKTDTEPEHFKIINSESRSRKAKHVSSRTTMKSLAMDDIMETLKREHVREKDVRTIDDKYGLRMQMGPLTFLINDEPGRCLVCEHERLHGTQKSDGFSKSKSEITGTEKSDLSSVSSDDHEDESDSDSENGEDEFDTETTEDNEQTVSVPDSDLEEGEITDDEDEIDTAPTSDATVTERTDTTSCPDSRAIGEVYTSEFDAATTNVDILESIQTGITTTTSEAGLEVVAAHESFDEEVVIIEQIPGNKETNTIPASTRSSEIEKVSSSSAAVRIPGILDDVDEISEENLLPDLNEICDFSELQEDEVTSSGLENDTILTDGFEASMSGIPADEFGDVENPDLTSIERSYETAESNESVQGGISSQPFWYKDFSTTPGSSSFPEPELHLQYERRKPVNRSGDREQRTENPMEYILDQSTTSPTPKKSRMEYLQFNEFGLVNSRGDVDMRVRPQNGAFFSMPTDEASGPGSWH